MKSGSYDPTMKQGYARSSLLLYTLWIGAIVAVYAGWVLWLLSPFLPWAYTGANTLFSVLAGGAILAIGLSAAGDAILWRSGQRITLLDSALLSFGLNAGAMLYASYTWSIIPTCSGGQSGPCGTPFIFCGLGLFSIVIGTVASVVGLVRLRRGSVATSSKGPSS